MILDAFAGCGGWDEGLIAAGFTDIVGIEWWHDACVTAMNAGHPRIRADIDRFPVGHLAGRVDGLVMSPPCTDFSVAGNKAGVDGDTGRLIWSVPEWVEQVRPRWFACEQVPPARGWWDMFAVRFRDAGYSTWVGVLNAADFGVPQTRRRAFLLGRRDGKPVGPPEPTHSKTPKATLFGGTLLPWVTMADALGWSDCRVGFPRVDDRGTSADGMRTRDWRAADQPSFALTEKTRSWQLDRRCNYRDGKPTTRTVPVAEEPAPTVTGTALSAGVWTVTRPATTIVGSFRPDIVAAPGWRGPGDGPRQNAEGSIKITVEDALILQSFRPDYPLHGSRTSQFKQVGNAVCPTVAQALCTQFLEP